MSRPRARKSIGDRGYDSDRFRAALIARGITPCIPSRRNRKVKQSYRWRLYRQRHRIGNMSARRKDRRRVATRHDRCAHTFLSAIALAATVIFWINEA